MPEIGQSTKTTNYEERCASACVISRAFAFNFCINLHRIFNRFEENTDSFSISPLNQIQKNHREILTVFAYDLYCFAMKKAFSIQSVGIEARRSSTEVIN